MLFPLMVSACHGHNTHVCLFIDLYLFVCLFVVLFLFFCRVFMGIVSEQEHRGMAVQQGGVKVFE